MPCNAWLARVSRGSQGFHRHDIPQDNLPGQQQPEGRVARPGHRALPWRAPNYDLYMADRPARKSDLLSFSGFAILIHSTPRFPRTSSLGPSFCTYTGSSCSMPLTKSRSAGLGRQRTFHNIDLSYLLVRSPKPAASGHVYQYFSTGACMVLEAPAPVLPAYQRLPSNVHARIADYVREANDGPDGVCETCVLRDLASYARVCRSWGLGMSERLYSKITLIGDESPSLRKRMKTKYGCRLLLLLRTLGERPDLAAYVRELSVPPYDACNITLFEAQSIHTTLAAVILRCPNLERLLGIYEAYSGPENQLHRALISRSSLKEHIWIMNSACPMQFAESESFAGIHTNWSCLETLVMQGNNVGGGLNHLVFADIFGRLPKLKKLGLVRFHDYEFDDKTLAALPGSLEALRLEELPGVTEMGLCAFLRSPTADTIRSLSLVDMDLLLLATVSLVLQELPILEKLTLLQTSSPQLPSSGPKPQLASKTLQQLHWDVLIPDRATQLLARAIYKQQFPRLRRLRAPSDHHGILQAVCRPRDSVLLPRDHFATTLPAFQAAAEGTSYSRLLPLARVEAEARLEHVRKSIRLKIVLTPAPAEEEEGGVYQESVPWEQRIRQYEQEECDDSPQEEVQLIDAVLGDIRSSVDYDLEPDLEGAWEAVARVPDLCVSSRARERLSTLEGVGERRRKVCEGVEAKGRKKRKGHVKRLRGDGGVSQGLGVLF